MRIYLLDALRFIASISVVLFHYVARYTWDEPIGSSFLNSVSIVTQFGYLGVPLFFMISGYVILRSAMNRSVKDFLISRFIRLYPAYWIAIVFTLSVVIFVNTGSIVEVYSDFGWRDFFANLTMLQSYVGIMHVDGVYWTLIVELKFYIFIAILITLKILPYYRCWVTIWLACTVMYLLVGQPFFMGMIINPYYSPFFIAGVLFCLIHNNIGSKPYWFFLLAISFLCAADTVKDNVGSFIPESTLVEAYFAILICGLFFLIFLALSMGRLNMKKSTIWMTLGAMTYPLYLIHNVAGKVLIDAFSAYISVEVSIAIVIVVMLILSYLMWRYLEQNIAGRLKKHLLGAFK